MKISAKRKIFGDADDFDSESQLTDQEAEELVNSLMSDPEVEIGPIDRNGFQPIFYAGQMIGLLNPSQGMGIIDREAYDALRGAGNDVDPDDDIIMFSKDIKADDDVTSEDSLKSAIKEALDSDLCEEIVKQAFSEDEKFADDVFTFAGGKDDSFFEALNDDTPRNVAFMFFEGKDLDEGGPANPGRDYFRFDRKGNIESTDEPGEVYMDTILDDIVDYIVDNMEEVEFPEKIDKLINKYLDNEER